jgi:ABC-type nitrate/sulfonate/bicarbonate transport system permease component
MRKVAAVLAILCLAIPLGVQAQTPFGIQSPPGLPSPSSVSEKLTELAGEGIIFNPYV